MMVSLHQTSFGSPFQATHVKGCGCGSVPNQQTLLTKSLLLPGFETVVVQRSLFSSYTSATSTTTTTYRKGKVRLTPVQASLMENPVLWAGKLCVYYALLKTGLAGSPTNPFTSDFRRETDDLGFSEWLGNFQGKSEDTEAANGRKLVSKWHPTTKGTLKRSYRVPSKSVGQRLLKAIASTLSEDDHFIDVTSHKGCQIRRENAHAESVCCNNVRALFDELPTPHLVLEITAFPAGPLTDNDYIKAEKLEKVLKTGASI